MKKTLLYFIVSIFVIFANFSQELTYENIRTLKVVEDEHAHFVITGINKCKNILLYVNSADTAEKIKQNAENIYLVQKKQYYKPEFIKQLNFQNITLYEFKFTSFDESIDFVNRKKDLYFFFLDGAMKFNYSNYYFVQKIIFSENEYIGNGEDLIIYFPDLDIQKRMTKEEEIELLSDAIICKKYNFKSPNDYKKWKENFNKLYISLNIGDYSGATPFKIGDLTFLGKNLFTIEDMSYNNGQYRYLVTAGKNALSKGCIIYSSWPIEYIDYYNGSMITEMLLLKCIGQEEYKIGYNIYLADVWENLSKDSKESQMLFELNEIEKNPHNFEYILNDEE